MVTPKKVVEEDEKETMPGKEDTKDKKGTKEKYDIGKYIPKGTQSPIMSPPIFVFFFNIEKRLQKWAKAFSMNIWYV